MRGICTLEEYDSHYSLKDLLDANEALDIMDEQEIWSNNQSEQAIAKQRLEQGHASN